MSITAVSWLGWVKAKRGQGPGASGTTIFRYLHMDTTDFISLELRMDNALNCCNDI